MAIAQKTMKKVKNEANISITRAKARQAQVNAHAQVLKAKSFINRAQIKAQ